MDNQSTTPPSNQPTANTPPQGPTIPETPPPPPASVPPPASEPIPPKVQEHLDNNPHANEPIKPHHSKKFYSLLIFMIVVLLLIAGGLTWYLLVGSKAAAPSNNQIVAPIATPTITPTPDPIADWQTYNDDTLAGVEFRYPSEWEVKANEGGGRYLEASDGTTLRPIFLNKQPNQSLQQRTHRALETDLVETTRKVEYVEDKEISINELKGWHSKIIYPFPAAETLVVIENLNNKDKYLALWMENMDDNDIQTLDQILSTIMFTAASSISAEGTVTPTP